MRISTLITCLCFGLFLAIFLLASRPAKMVGLEENPIFPWGKFGVHLIPFALFSFLVHAIRWPKCFCWQAVVFLVLFGITTEFLQHFIPLRHARLSDALENILGIALGTGIYWLIQRRRQ